MGGEDEGERNEKEKGKEQRKGERREKKGIEKRDLRRMKEEVEEAAVMLEGKEGNKIE